MTQVSGSLDGENDAGSSGADAQPAAAIRPLARPAERLAISAQSYEFPETAEKLVVDKQLVVREEVTVRKVVETHSQQIDDTVRRTEVEVERLPAGAPAPAPPTRAAPAPVASMAAVEADRPLAREPLQETPAPPAPARAEPPAQEVTFVDPAVANEPTGAAAEPAPLVFGLKDRAVSTAQAKEPPPAPSSTPAPATARTDAGEKVPPLVFGINDAPPARAIPREPAPASKGNSEGSEIPQSWWIWCAVLSVLAIVLAFYGGSLLATL